MTKRIYDWGWKMLKKIFEKTNGRCYYCGDVLPPDNESTLEKLIDGLPTRNWDVDHKTPLSRGGSNDVDNLVPACKTCNNRKGNKTISEFMDTPYLQKRLGWKS